MKFEARLHTSYLTAYDFILRRRLDDVFYDYIWCVKRAWYESTAFSTLIIDLFSSEKKETIVPTLIAAIRKFVYTQSVTWHVTSLRHPMTRGVLELCNRFPFVCFVFLSLKMLRPRKVRMRKFTAAIISTIRILYNQIKPKCLGVQFYAGKYRHPIATLRRLQSNLLAEWRSFDFMTISANDFYSTSARTTHIGRRTDQWSASGRPQGRQWEFAMEHEYAWACI